MARRSSSSLLRFLRLSTYAIVAATMARPVLAACQASIIMSTHKNGAQATLRGRGNCFSGTNQGGGVRMRLAVNGGPFMQITSCVDGECVMEITEAFSCQPHLQWSLEVACTKNDGPDGCIQDEDGHDTQSVDLDHS